MSIGDAFGDPGAEGSAPLFIVPRLRGGKGTGFVRSRQATENPVTRFPLGKGGAVRHHLYPKGAAHRARRLCRRVEEKGSKGSKDSKDSKDSKGCGGALRAHYIMAPPAPTLPPRSGLYNSPLNQPEGEADSGQNLRPPRGEAPAAA